MSFSGLLNAEMDVQTRGVTVDAYGGQTETPATLYTAQPCRVDTLSKQKQADLMRAGITATHKIYCDGDMTILPEYYLISGGVTYRVVDVVDVGGASNTTHHLELLTVTPT